MAGRWTSELSRSIGSPASPQLPLLPGEYEFLRDQGLLARFAKHEHRSVSLDFHGRRIVVESIVGNSPACLCTHDFRTTVCRLYPMLPVFDVDGRLCDVDLLFGSFEMLEELQGLERICKIEFAPAREFAKFAAIAREIGMDPVACFYLTAYRAALRHVQSQLLAQSRGRTDTDFFRMYEMALIRNKLFDWTQFNAELDALAGQFETRHGGRFHLSTARV